MYVCRLQNGHRPQRIKEVSEFIEGPEEKDKGLTHMHGTLRSLGKIEDIGELPGCVARGTQSCVAIWANLQKHGISMDWTKVWETAGWAKASSVGSVKQCGPCSAVAQRQWQSASLSFPSTANVSTGVGVHSYKLDNQKRDFPIITCTRETWRVSDIKKE